MDTVLTINGGSSSLKLALYPQDQPRGRLLGAKLDRIGLPGATLAIHDLTTDQREQRAIAAPDPASAARVALDWLEQRPEFATLRAVGHRIVHGFARPAPELVGPELLADLRRLRPSDPEHLPLEIELIEAITRRHPGLPQVACFDTTFHRTMPRVARLLPIPRRYFAMGLQRYGFHGLSCEFLLEELARLGDPAATTGRVILAHLGSGASMTAVRNGASIDTSMAFTPGAGLVMSTRSGDLDPGVGPYLARTEQMTPERFQAMVNHESGLLGVSETSPDLRDLLAHEATDPRAADAVALFCHQARKWLGALAAVLGGLDTLVFAGGVGENAPLIRQRICEDLTFLGVTLDPQRNAANAPLISAPGQVNVRVIATDEESVIARSVVRVLALGSACVV